MLETYRFNHPNVLTVRADLRQKSGTDDLIDAANSELNGRHLNLIAGGPPCQGFSTAGKWTASDRRNSLPFKLIDLVEAVEPSYVLIENVPGLKWLEKGKYLEDIQHRLNALGYTTSVLTLRAEEYGVPQRRRRVFVLGSIKGDSYDIPPGTFTAFSISRTRNSVVYESPEKPRPISVQEAISDLPPLADQFGAPLQEYTPADHLSSYQKLMRGLISYEDFLIERAEQG
jgi:DNA (cytosine-5)-methyltransferase 1